MALILAAGDDTYYLVNGIPYQRGHLLPVFDSAAGTVALRYRESIRNELFATLLYSDYTDATTGLPFASFNALVTWFTSYAYAGAISLGGSSGITFSKVFSIVASPVADNEKAAGATFTDAWLVGATVTCMIVAGVIYTGASITHNSGTGSIGITDSTFNVGDTVVIFIA